MDYYIKELQDEEFILHDWESLMFLLSIALSCIYIATILNDVLVCQSGQGYGYFWQVNDYKSLCHLMNTANESIWIPNLNRLLITLFMPYHSNITSDVFVIWLTNKWSWNLFFERRYPSLAVYHTKGF